MTGNTTRAADTLLQRQPKKVALKGNKDVLER
jgi:hypothetical protein